MKYTGWCQNGFNVYAHLEADLDAGTPRISCFTSAALHEKAISWQAIIFIINDSRYEVLRAARRKMSFPPTLRQPMLPGQPAVQIYVLVGIFDIKSSKKQENEFLADTWRSGAGPEGGGDVYFMPHMMEPGVCESGDYNG